MRRVLRYVLVLAALAALGAAWPRLFPKKPIEVKVFRAALGEVRETISSPSAGTVVSEHEAIVAAEATGRVVAAKLREGDHAGEGQVVIALDASEAELELRAAKAARDRHAVLVEQARLKFKKVNDDADRALRDPSLVSEEQLRATLSARDVAKSEVEWVERQLVETEVAIERARVALNKRAIAAPFTGMIRKRRVELGEFVAPGTPCFEIYDDLHTYVRAPVDEVDLPRIRANDPVEITLESFPDHVFHGRVRDIDPAVRTTVDLNRTGEVEIELADAPHPEKDGSYPPGVSPIRVGMSADIEVIARVKTGVLKVPSYAVHEDAAGHYVYLVAGGQVARRAVKLGISNWDFAEIVEGLADRDAVIVTLDVEGLKDGALATIAGEVTRVAPQ